MQTLTSSSDSDSLLEQGYGGPVWHASIAHHGKRRLPPGVEHFDRCHRALQNVGDHRLGMWTEGGGIAFHLRKRLSLPEQAAAGLVVADIRGTPEAAERLEAVRRWLPDGYTE